MQALLLGVLLLVLILLVGRAYVRADPARLAWLMKRAGGILVIGAALALIATGRLIVALPIAAFGFWLLGKRFPFFPGGGADDFWGASQRSSVRTAMLEMTLDHATGATDGRVLSGRFAGRQLSDMSQNELVDLLEECTLRDPQGAQLLRAYMERMGTAGAGQGRAGAGGGRNSGARGPNGGMSVEEALEVLGLKPGASQDEIQQAHRTLMKKVHPDQGGSTYLASKINEAKDVLLRQA